MSPNLHSLLLSALALANLESSNVPGDLRQRRTPWAAGPSPLANKTTGRPSRMHFLDRFRQKANSSKTPIQRLRGDPRLQQLPTELVLEITQYLPLASAIALSHTCHKFRQMTDVYIGDLFPPIVAGVYGHIDAQGKDEALQAEQLEFLNFLAADGKLSASQMVCNDCKKLQNTNLFSPHARRQKPSERKCIGHEGGVWVCPHRIFTHADCKKLETRFWERTNRKECRCPVTAASSAHFTLSVKYSVLTASPSSVFGLFLNVEGLVETLKAAKIPFCPHQRSDDLDIIENIYSRCPKSKRNMNSYVHTSGWEMNAYKHRTDWYTKVRPECHSCQTQIEFGLGHGEHNRSRIEVTVSRRLGDSKEIYPVTDSKWYMSVMKSQHFDSLARDWDRCSKSWPRETAAEPSLEREIADFVFSKPRSPEPRSPSEITADFESARRRRL